MAVSYHFSFPSFKKKKKTYLFIIIHDMLLYFGGIHPSDKIFHISRKKQNKNLVKLLGRRWQDKT